MKKSIVGLVAIGALVAAPAVAADLRMPVKAPPAPIAPLYSWTGLYIGAGVGGEWETIDGSFVFPPPASWEIKNSRGVADAHVGAQYQLSNVVFGVEGQFAGLFSNSGGTSACNPATSCTAGATMRANLVDDIWSVGGRLGVAINAWMPYVTGGYASTRVDNTFTDVTGSDRSRTTHGGTYFGGGIDWQVLTRPGGALVAGIEYRHYEFQSQTVVPIIVATGAPIAVNTWTIQPRADTIEARLSWLFNFGGGPVAARY